MPFFFKKLASGLLLPLPISLILLFIGFCLLLWTRLRKTGVTVFLSGFFILILFSISPVANQLLNGLEQQYHPLKKLPANIKYIVVLGGGSGAHYRYPPNTHISSASLSRLIGGIRLHRQNENSVLILSGGRVFGSPAEANVMNNTAVALGVARSHMKIEAGSKDTRQEAIHLQPLLKNRAFVLVTSATHMPRAMAVFKKLGMHPIAAPTQFLAKNNRYRIQYYLPSVGSLIHSDIALHEYTGQLWAHIRGYI